LLAIIRKILRGAFHAGKETEVQDSRQDNHHRSNQFIAQHDAQYSWASRHIAQQKVEEFDASKKRYIRKSQRHSQ
jgi:hypothetical protein